MNIIADLWKDYEILDAGNGMKLERWKNVILSRPDPQVIWKPVKPEIWAKAIVSITTGKATLVAALPYIPMTLPMKIWSVML